MMQGGIMLAAVAMIVLRGAGTGNGYGAFLRGAKRGMTSAWELLPALCAMSMMVTLVNASGLSRLMCHALSPLTRLMNLPPEVAPILVLRPLSGSGSLTALKAIFGSCGVDSRAGRAAAVLMGSSETIFYTMTVYLGATDIKKLPWTLPVSLISYLVGAWVCGMVV